MHNVQEIVKEFILREFLPGEAPDLLTEDTSLFETGIVDSIGRLRLVAFLEETYDISVQAREVSPANLGSLARIAQYVERKKQ